MIFCRSYSSLIVGTFLLRDNNRNNLISGLYPREILSKLNLINFLKKTSDSRKPVAFRRVP